MTAAYILLALAALAGMGALGLFFWAIVRVPALNDQTFYAEQGERE